MPTYYGSYDYTMQYDWCFGGSRRTPEEYPYSYDAFFIWRKAKYAEGSAVYSDRMFQWDYDKAREAFKNTGAQGSCHITPEQANQIIKKYYGADHECLAYAVGCNVSNGYPYSIFWVKKNEA